MRELDVVIVGAGPAGIGMALELCKIDGLEFGVLESDRVGESFHRWPAQTRLITPSFNSNPFGLIDLNAVDTYSSPAIFAGAEHLSGEQYADYLTFIAKTNELPIATGCKVLQVDPDPNGGFHLKTEHGDLFTQFLIWACGEYQFPDLKPFPGAHLCQHYAQIEDWQAIKPGSYTVIGGYESGLDSAINLLKLGYEVCLLVRRQTWDLPDVSDPSQVLSPYTRQRLREVETDERLQIVFDVNVVEVSKESQGHYYIYAADGRFWESANAPILGTGFIKGGGARQIQDLWFWGDNGHIELSSVDESIYTPGLFLVGPQVRHEQGIYCFIYKFRQRFAGISRQIAQRLGLDIEQPIGSEDGIWGPFGNSECCEGCEC
jgi:putative flavoprotein involved in K+ transport